MSAHGTRLPVHVQKIVSATGEFKSQLPDLGD